MKVLQILAHPDITGKSFCHQLAEQFRRGALESGHDPVIWINLFDPDYNEEVIDFQSLVSAYDHLCLVYPVWWEMPPAKMVHFLQSTFVRGFAFDSVDDRMIPKLRMDATCILSLGQDIEYNTTNMTNAMLYCGLYPKFVLAKNVGPRMSEEFASQYMADAFKAGTKI